MNHTGACLRSLRKAAPLCFDDMLLSFRLPGCGGASTPPLLVMPLWPPSSNERLKRERSEFHQAVFKFKVNLSKIIPKAVLRNSQNSWPRQTQTRTPSRPWRSSLFYTGVYSSTKTVPTSCANSSRSTPTNCLTKRKRAMYWRHNSGLRLGGSTIGIICTPKRNGLLRHEHAHSEGGGPTISPHRL